MILKFASFLIGIIWSYSLIKTQSIFSKKAGLIFKIFITKVSWITLIAAIYFGYKNFSIKLLFIGLVVGILNVGVGIMGLIKNFMKYEKKFNSHNDYYKKYKKLSRRLNTMKLMVLPKDYKNTIKELTTELNNLLDDEPSLPIKYMIKKTDVDKFDDDGNNNISHLCKVVTNEDNNDKDDESEGFLDKIENAASKAVDFVEDVIENHGDTIVDLANKHGEDVVDFVKDNV